MKRARTDVRVNRIRAAAFLLTDARVEFHLMILSINLPLAHAYNILTPRVTFVHNTSYSSMVLMR